MHLLANRYVLIFLSLLVLFMITFISVAWFKAPAKAAGKRLEAMHNSPQWHDGRFSNALPHSQAGLWQMLKAQWNNPNKHKKPSQPIPVHALGRDDFNEIPTQGIRVSWLGHSTVLLEMEGYRILTDPVWSERASPFSFAGPKRFFAPPLPLEQLPDIDAVIISHDHFDHLDEATIKKLRDRVPLFIVPLGLGAHLEAWGVSADKIVERDWWQSHRLGTLTFTATPARHFSGRALTNIFYNQTLWSGWAIAGERHKVYFSGDTAMFPGFREIGERLGPFDLTLIELGAYNALWPDVHIGPEQALQAHKMVRGKLMMPIHWATFDLALHNWTEPGERLMAANRDGAVQLVFPKPGQTFNTTAPPPARRWWPEVPWQTATEAPIVSTGLKPVLPGVPDNSISYE